MTNFELGYVLGNLGVKALAVYVFYRIVVKGILERKKTDKDKSSDDS